MKILLVLGTVLLLATHPLAGQADNPTSMRIAGNFSSNTRHVDLIERPFFTGLPEATGLEMRINYNPMDVVNVKADDALRLLRSGTFDVMSVQIGMASRDDPTFEGIDLIGVSTNMKELREAVDAYRDAFDQRLQKRFKAKLITLWPFGPQVFYCNQPISSVDDFKGLKIRSFTPSMAALIKHLGGTPITLQFSEVYPALQRGVADCAVTSPASGNAGNWPEVTTHFFPLSVSGSVQGHFMNFNYWNKFTPESQQKLLAEFKKLEDQMWELAETANADAIACNVGQDLCTEGTKFNMKLVPVASEDERKVKEAVTAVVLPLWKETCNRVNPECTGAWNNTVGKARGYTIE
ncbi:MAG: TRAP transporter substrate-binding protein [Gammaproteobacteria bacterium]|nr:TRAP transporter substrate-binding protein [Gammaproteobacteria bacterium]